MDELSKFKTRPYNHQLYYLNNYSNRKYFALLSEMGTGKSWMVINNIADLWSQKEVDAVLIFAPNGVHSNWTRLEIPKHMPDWVNQKSAPWISSPKMDEKKRIDELFDVADSGCLRILAMNWEALQTKNGFEAAKKFATLSMRLMIICDESDSIKNPSAIRTKNLMKLKPYSKYRRIMTGTPINNSPFDAFSQFSFLDENILQTTSFFAFKAEYAEMMNSESRLIQKIAKEKTKMPKHELDSLRLSILELHTRLLSNGREELYSISEYLKSSFEEFDFESIPKYTELLISRFDPRPNRKKQECIDLINTINSIVKLHLQKISKAAASRRMPQIVEKDKTTGKKKYRNLEKLSKLIAPHSYRVLKSECLDLPDKLYKTITFKLTKEQKEVYKKAAEQYRLEFEGSTTVFNKLVAVTKLSQITSGYYLHPDASEPVKIEGDNPKLDLLIERVERIVEAGEKVIIWARYTVEIKDIVKAIKERLKYSVVEYYGEIGKKEREFAIDSFENGNADVFVGNQKAGGTGLTLVAASYVIYFSNDYSLRNRLQSEDRAHRIGQVKNVTYINIVGEDTIDEAVVKAINDKKDIAETIVDKGLEIFKAAERL